MANILYNNGEQITGGAGSVKTIDYSVWSTMTDEQKAISGLVEVTNYPQVTTVSELASEVEDLSKVATRQTKGLMSASDKTKLDGIATNATNDKYTKSDYMTRYMYGGLIEVLPTEVQIVGGNFSGYTPTGTIVETHDTVMRSLGTGLGKAEATIDTINQNLANVVTRTIEGTYAHFEFSKICGKVKILNITTTSSHSAIPINQWTTVLDEIPSDFTPAKAMPVILKGGSSANAYFQLKITVDGKVQIYNYSETNGKIGAAAQVVYY